MKVIVWELNLALIFYWKLCSNLCRASSEDYLAESATFGESTRQDEFPFMTALGWWNPDTDITEFLCGGMLIAPNFVLTAAHCVFFKGKLPNVIKVGGNRLNSTYNEIHKPGGFFLYPGYEDGLAYNDVALLLLKNASKKAPICLWSEAILSATDVVAIGYGATTFAGSGTTILQRVDLNLVSTKACQEYHKGMRRFRFGLSDTHLCAGDIAGGEDTCHGDSGGPLIWNKDGKQYAIGIISGGQACHGHPPATYTKVSSYISWIRGILQYLNTQPLLCG